MGSLNSRFLPSVSATDTKTQGPITDLDHFPETEDEAKAEYIKILKEMEYRSVRAAKMAYELSDKFENKHILMTQLVSFATAMSSFSLQFKGKSSIFGLGMPLYFRAGSISLAATSVVGIGFYQNYHKLLPLYHNKFVDYNKAGARWQALEFRIRFDRATSLQNDISVKDLRKRGLDFADERRQICEIARPFAHEHDKYEEDYSGFVEIKKKNLEAVASYFGVENEENAKPTDKNDPTE